MFVASPAGNGPDCHRTWEAIYLKVIPIVLKSEIDEIFKMLPIYVIDTWDELLNLTELDLLNIYNNLINRDPSKAYADYWINLIERHRFEFK